MYYIVKDEKTKEVFTVTEGSLITADSIIIGCTDERKEMDSVLHKQTDRYCIEELDSGASIIR